MTVIRMSTEGENTKNIAPENNGETKSDENAKEPKPEPEKAAENGADKPEKEEDDVEAEPPKDAKESEDEQEKPKNKSDKNPKAEPKGEQDSENEENGSEKDVPLLDQPLEKAGKRERKNVQRFTDSPEVKDAKDGVKVDIPKGSGTALGNIPRIDASISRFKNDDLKMLHRILFKTVGKSLMIKKNIKKFNGFDFKKDSDEYEKKQTALEKYEVKQLKSVCEMLDLQKNGSKDDIVERIIDFLLEPKDSGKAVAGGRPKRTAAVKANNRGYSSHDNYSSDERHSGRGGRDKGKRSNLKDDSSSQSDEDFHPSDLSDVEEKPRVTKRKRNSRKKLDSDDEEDSDELIESESSEDEEEEEDEDSDEDAKNKRKRAVKTNNKTKGKTPSRRGRKPGSGNKKTKAAKKRIKDSTDEDDDDDEEESDQKEEEEVDESSSEDEPLAKKAKGTQPPTDDEIKSYIKEILEGANLEEITMKTVCQQVYAHYPDFDLAHKKDFIKSTVKSLIST